MKYFKQRFEGLWKKFVDSEASDWPEWIKKDWQDPKFDVYDKPTDDQKIYFMKDDFYTQCRFQRKEECPCHESRYKGITMMCFMCTGEPGNTLETIAYIPSWAAKVGNEVQLLSLDGAFWKVLEAGTPISKEFIKENERNYKEFQHSTNGGGID